MTKKQYLKPVVLNLSGLSAIGYGSKGMCWGGSEPTTETCANGPDVTQEKTCTPNGVAPDYGNCNEGGHVAVDCSIGSIN